MAAVENGVTPSRHTSGRQTSQGQERSSLILCDGDSPMDPKVQKKDTGCPQRVLRFLKDNLLMTLSVLGVIIGFIVGFAVRTADPSPTAIMWLGLPGQLFLNLLQMTIVPLIVSSVISAIATMDPRENGKIASWFMAYLALTNLIVGSGLGVILGLVMRLDDASGNGSEQNSHLSGTELQTSDIIADLLRNLVPANLVRAAVQKVQTTYISPENEIEDNMTEAVRNTTEKITKSSVVYVDSMNTMGLIFGSAVFGLACSQLPQKSKPFVDFFNASTELVLLILQWFVWTTPVGAFSLVAASIAAIDDLADIFRQLGIFVAVVSAGVLAQQIVIFPAIYAIFTRTNPFKAMLKLMKVWFIAFASVSSACAMPYMYHVCEDLGYDKRVYKFGIPLMVTFNANGSTFFISVAVQLMAVMSGTPLDMGELLVIWLLVTVTCMALPALPSASLVGIVIVCTTLNIPANSVGLLFAVEWLLDRLRTTSNVTSEILGIGVVNGIVRKELARKDHMDSSTSSTGVCNGKLDNTVV